MKHFARYGLNEFVLCLGYKGHVIKDYFLNYEAMSSDMTVTLGRGGEGHGAGVELHGKHFSENWRVTLAETGLDALTDARVMADISRAMARDTVRDVRGYY